MTAVVDGDRPALGLAALTHLAPIALDELVENAALQTRVDRKYLVPLDTLQGLLTHLDTRTRVLEVAGRRTFAYESVYFDTPDLLAYRLAAHRRRRRFKVRTRGYLDSGEWWLEVKTRGARGLTVKQRAPHDALDRATVEPGRAFVVDALAREGVALPVGVVLLPTLVTRYLRTTLHLPGTHDGAESRATIDTHLTWHDGGTLEVRGVAVVETKTGSAPSALDRVLWSHGHRPVRVSKFGTGLAALHPELPAAPWRRVLRRELRPATRVLASPIHEGAVR